MSEEKRNLQKESPYAAALRMLDAAAEKINLNKNIWERLRHPRRCLIVTLPVMMDDGSLKIFEGYRVQHDYSRGPAKAEILKWYIILHLEPISSNTRATELGVFRIRLCLCKIKYGGFICPLFFKGAVFSRHFAGIL